MYILRNAIENLKRNQGRNLLIVIVMTTIIIATGLTITMHTSAQSMMNEYKNSYGMNVYMKSSEPIDYSLLSRIEENKLLLKSNYMAKIAYTSSSFITIGESQKKYDPYDSDRLIPQGYLIASSSSQINDDFKNQTKKIVSGKIYQKNNEAIISQTLASKNQLKVNDTIQLKSTSQKNPTPLILIISGIYENLSVGQKEIGLALTNSENEIYGSLEGILQSSLYQNKGIIEATLSLRDPAKLEELQKELPQNITITTDNTNYQNVTQSLYQILNITNILTIGILGLGIIILILINHFAIRERQYEIGVLRAMGMKKKQVAVGFIYEMLFLTVICLLIGLTIVGISGKPLGDYLLTQQISIINNISIGLSFYNIIHISMISLLLGIVSSVSGIIYVTRYEPQKILSERN